jgi:Transcriptional regulators
MRNIGAAVKVYETIKDEIFQNLIKPQTVLVVDELTQRFKVSRTPIREALLALCGEGFLEARHHIGFIVTAVDIQKIIQTYSLRALIEKESARLAARRIDDETLGQLAMKIQEPGRMHHRMFHSLIAKASGWEVLAEVLEGLMDRSARAHAILSQNPVWHEEGLDESDKPVEKIYGHQEIYEALLARDPAAAAYAMEQHINEARERVLRAVSSI